MKNRFATLLFLLLPIVALFYFFVENNLENNIDTLKHITKLQEVKLMNSELNDIILNLGNTAYGNFDDINRLTKQMPETLESLKGDITFCTKSYNLAILQIRDKTELVDTVKQKAAIIRNSLGYLPSITKSIIDSKIDNALLVLIVEAFKDSSYALQTGDENIQERLRDTLEKIHIYIQKNNLQEGEVALFYTHLKLVEDEVFVFKKTVKEALEIPLDATLQRMIDVTKNVHEEERYENRMYEYFSLAIVLLLGAISYYFFYKNEQSRERLLDSAKYDSLSGAKSRFYLSKYMLENKFQKKYLILFDVKNFSALNDAYGHESGDKILTAFHFIVSKTFKTDTFRVDSDRFVILLDDYSKEGFEQQLVQMGEKIQRTPIYFEFYTLIYPLKGAVRFDAIFPDLEAGIYALKKTPNSLVLLYDPANKHIAHHKDLSKNALKKRDYIEKALKEGKFVPFYQPILNIKTGAVEKYEVLMRVCEDGKYLPPFEYIITAEKFNLINEISKQIVAKSFAFSAQNPGIEFSINLSTYDLENEKMLHFIKEEAQKRNLNTNLITFEITETGIMSDLSANAKYLKGLKEMGFLIAIDDFGVGQSSLQYLKELPADIIKIDGSFIKNVYKNRTDREFVDLINKIIKISGMKSVAEFVEDENILETLRKLDVDYAQGYFIGKPTHSLEVLK